MERPLGFLKKPLILSLSLLASFASLLGGFEPALGFESAASLFAPVGGTITSQFGWRTDPFNGSHRFHSGIDIAAAAGTPVYVPQNGIVVFAGNYGGYGNVVVIDHGYDLYTLYGHTSTYYVRPGQSVYRGQAIAAVGSTGRSTGPHLHFEVHQKRQYVNPMAYLSYLQTHVPGTEQHPRPMLPLPEQSPSAPIDVAVSNGSPASGTASAGIAVGVGTGVGGLDLDEGSGVVTEGQTVQIAGPPVPKTRTVHRRLSAKHAKRAVEVMQGEQTVLVKF